MTAANNIFTPGADHLVALSARPIERRRVIR